MWSVGNNEATQASLVARQQARHNVWVRVVFGTVRRRGRRLVDCDTATMMIVHGAKGQRFEEKIAAFLLKYSVLVLYLLTYNK